MRKPRILIVVSGLLAVSCCVWSQEAKPKAEEPASVEIMPQVTDVHVGDKIKMTAAGKDAAGKQIEGKPAAWFAAPGDVAFVDDAGTVTFFAPGRATLGTVINGKPGYLRINVLPMDVARIEIEQPGRPVVVGGVLKLSATPRTERGDPREEKAVEWSSGNPSLATVDAAGVVSGIAPGSVKIQAKSGAAVGSVTIKITTDPVQKLAIAPKSTKARTGDVIHFTASARDSKGGPVKNPSIVWSLSGSGATIYPDGGFVADEPGTYLIGASSGQHQATASIVVTPRNVEREIEVVSHVLFSNEQASEEWIIGSHAYLGTISDHLNVYDIADPANPKMLDSLKVDARLINDVSTTPDERIGVITREGASNRKNGIVFLDTSDAAHLKVISEYTATVTGGVHSAFVDGHYVYVTDDATGSLRVIDFQDVKNPKEVARYEVAHKAEADQPNAPAPSEFSKGLYLHDLQVKDGLAYLAYWRDGLVILDVGNGMKGGSPEHPQEVGRFFWNHHELYGDGWIAGTHSTFRYKNYLFVGDEVLPDLFNIGSRERIPTRAILHVLDVTDLQHPREVAQYQVPEGGSHNFWVANDILYEGYYNGGGRVLDVSGELRGDLYRQGREIARLWTGDPKGFRPNLPMTWGGQPCSIKCSSDLLNGLIYFNDINSGLWIAKLGKPKYRGSTFATPTRESNGVIH
jgi:hypothetical protein